MFTGIIEEIGTCVVLEEIDSSLRLLFSAEKVLDELKVDDSIAVNGVCLTVTSTDFPRFAAWAVAETLKKTTLGSLKVGDHVNLERAATLSTRLGGHLVQGHIDGLATVKEVISAGGGSWEFFVEVPQEYMRYIIPRGSIAINGVSLTVAEVVGSVIKIAIIPHTYSETIFQWLREGDKVNIELDIIAKMVERLMSK
ncbi:MAG TPA: riboflavin synthase [Candidatus Kapabacteria bacterium]